MSETIVHRVFQDRYGGRYQDVSFDDKGMVSAIKDYAFRERRFRYGVSLPQYVALADIPALRAASRRRARSCKSIQPTHSSPTRAVMPARIRSASIFQATTTTALIAKRMRLGGRVRRYSKHGRPSFAATGACYGEVGCKNWMCTT